MFWKRNTLTLIGIWLTWFVCICLHSSIWWSTPRYFMVQRSSWNIYLQFALNLKMLFWHEFFQCMNFHEFHEFSWIMNFFVAFFSISLSNRFCIILCINFINHLYFYALYLVYANIFVFMHEFCFLFEMFCSNTLTLNSREFFFNYPIIIAELFYGTATIPWNIYQHFEINVL